MGRIFAECTGTSSQPDDGLPGHLCAGCNLTLIGFNKFRRRCIQWDQHFRSMLNETTAKKEQQNEGETDWEANVAKDDGSKIIEYVKCEQSTDFEDDDNNEDDDAVKCGYQVLELAYGNYEQESSNKKDNIRMIDDADHHNKDEVIDEDVSDGNVVDDDNDPDYHMDDDQHHSENDINEDAGTSSTRLQSDKNSKRRLNRKSRAKTSFLINVEYECKICSARYSERSALAEHLRQEHIESSSLPSTDNIANDDDDDNDASKRYTCGIDGCTRSFKTRQAINSHYGQKHTKPKDDGDGDGGLSKAKPVPAPAPTTADTAPRFVCEQCGKMFSSSGSLKKHGYTHGDQLLPFPCTLCPKRCMTNHKLKVHMMRHEGVKNHVCPHCGLRKTTAYELKVHINYHTREKLWPCEKCDLVFSSVGNMTRHVRIVHCGIKKFACSYCDKSFGKLETQKNHEMTHTGEKPHACELCDRRFIQLVALQTHMRTHAKKGEPVRRMRKGRGVTEAGAGNAEAELAVMSLTGENSNSGEQFEDV